VAVVHPHQEEAQQHLLAQQTQVVEVEDLMVVDLLLVMVVQA